MSVSRRSTIVLATAALLLAAGCASKRVYREPVLGPDPVARPAPGEQSKPPPAPAPTPAEAVQMGIRVATLAHEQVGRPYAWGGESPGRGFDCSGLVQWSYGCVGINLPRVVEQQLDAGLSIDGGQLQPGDLVFFATDGRRTSHVGIYLGARRFVHAPGSSRSVRVDSLDDAWWHGRWTDSRRIIRG